MFTANKLMQTTQISELTIISLLIMGCLNIVFAIMLLYWKRIGFYGAVITGIITFLINIGIGISPIRALLGLAGVAILYGVLQIKKDDTSAWENLQ
jgi:small-conductance mechanosensitive channel